MIRRDVTRATLAGVGVCVSLACQEPPTGIAERLSAVPESVRLATERLRIGRSEGGGPDLFGSISFLAVDDLDRVYVADGIGQEVRVFDSAGHFVRSFGQEGDGPGEFRNITGLAFDGQSRAWVWDQSQQRLSVFDSTGAFVRSLPRRWPTYAVPWPGRFSPDGRLLDMAAVLRGLEPEKRVTKRFQQMVSVVRFDTALEVIDSGPPLGAERTAFAGNIIVPFEQGVLAALEEDGSLWSAHGSQYRVMRTDAAGDTVIVFGVDAPPEHVTSAERDSAVAAMNVPPAFGAMDPALIPEYKPAVRRLVRLAPGWVGAFPEFGPDTGRYVDVFDPEGRLKARVDLGTRLLLARGAPVARMGIIYGVTTDPFDVPFVVALDLGIPELRG